MKHKYQWWPIRVIWARGPLHYGLLRQLWRAVESYSWTLDKPYRFQCERALRVHQRAARRFWHGWPGKRSGFDSNYCWTLHIGRLKILFGK